MTMCFDAFCIIISSSQINLDSTCNKLTTAAITDQYDASDIFMVSTSVEY